jgi:ribosomal protein S18 acetylase RimI-like enzyme
VTHFRSFRNADPPALAALWNRWIPEVAVARPLTVHEFDAHVVGSPVFEADGLIVAERDGKLVGYIHAGFGPEERGRPLRLSYEIGAVGMLVADPGDPGLEDDLLAEAERYLRRRGATVVYAGGQYPLNPYYWGVYGGSEWAGILGVHDSFHRAVIRRGFEPVSSTVLLEADLSRPESRDPRGFLIRRQTRLEVTEDVLPPSWWEELAIGDFRPTSHRLLSKTDDAELARATTWDMTWFGRGDGRARIGLTAMEVRGDLRRKGYGRHLVNEILRQARSQATAVVAIQTRSTNTAALALYQSLGFDPVETATLYRLPGGLPSRPS